MIRSVNIPVYKPLSIRTILQQKLRESIADVPAISIRRVGGGSINDTYQVCFGDQVVFCKVNSASKFPQLFSKEKNGLERLASQGAIATPAVVNCFEEDGMQILLLQWVQEGERTDGFWKTFGEQLARLHRVTAADFGWEEDNYMGSVPQQNSTHKTWPAFFSAQRLQPMITRCTDTGLLSKRHHLQFDVLLEKLPEIFEEEPPSLLHGDLWSGNFLCSETAEPLLIDPAVYFGHRSMDLAMTTLFGGFRRPFYEAYQHHFPLPSNFEEQWAVCNLYPLLIHLYLFGSGYLPQVERTLQQFS